MIYSSALCGGKSSDGTYAMDEPTNMLEWLSDGAVIALVVEAGWWWYRIIGNRYYRK